MADCDGTHDPTTCWGCALIRKDKAEKENKRLGKALRFYARRENWVTPSRGFAAQYDPGPSLVEADSGARARAALKAQEVAGD